MKHITEFCMEAIEYPGNVPAKQYQSMIDPYQKNDAGKLDCR